MSGQGRPWPRPFPTGSGFVVPEHATQVTRSLAQWCGRRRGRVVGAPHDLAGAHVWVGICEHTVGPDGSGGNMHCHPALSLLDTVLQHLLLLLSEGGRSTPRLPCGASFWQFVRQPCCGSSQELSMPCQSTPKIHNHATAPPAPPPCGTFLKLCSGSDPFPCRDSVFQCACEADHPQH